MCFGDKVAVHNVDLSIQQGEFVVLLGPSGSGKTTLLNILGGFLQPTDGRVLIDGKDVTDVPASKRPTTTVFQDYALFPHMTVAGNVAFGLKMRGVSSSEQKTKIIESLELVGLAHLAERRIHQLSGGQRQRIALARALAVEPSVLLLDEPLGALDLKLRHQMQEELKEIQKRIGTTFIHVTHDQEEAMAIADTIVITNDGAIEDTGKPERIYLQPTSRFAAGFMGESNFLEGTVISCDGSQTMVHTAIGKFLLKEQGTEGDVVTLSIRPEHFSTKSGIRSLGEARILETGFFGTHHQCKAILEESETMLKVRLPQKEVIQSGELIELFIDPEDLTMLRS